MPLGRDRSAELLCVAVEYLLSQPLRASSCARLLSREPLLDEFIDQISDTVLNTLRR